MSTPSNVRKPLPGATSRAPAAELEKEAWMVRVIYGGGSREWTFTCDGVVVDELRRAMVEGRPAHLTYAGTEAILNPAHVASVEMVKQPQ